MNCENEIDLEHFKNLLVARKAQLVDLKQTGHDAGKTVELDQSRVGRLSRMDALQGQAMSKETQRRREIELQKISAALVRIDEEEYGFCLRCGEYIGEGRLNVDPSATLCVKCAD